jgi:hypothetical protein
MKTLQIFLLICSGIALNSCSDKCKGIDCFSPPSEFRFKILNQNLLNVSNTIDTIKFVYLEKGISKEIKPIKVSVAPNEVFFTSNQIGWASVGLSTDFDLKINNISRGRLTIKENSVNIDCCTFFEIEQLTFKNKSILNIRDMDYCYSLVIE